MPSPFPGMDPWLEDPRLWPDVHHEIISVIREELNRRLRPRYHARVEERVYLSDDDDPGRTVIVRDLKIRQAKRKSVRVPVPEVDVPEPVVSITLIDQEVHEAYISLVDTTDRSVVTIIEVLSPTNKVAGSRGRVEYQYKRRNVMRSQSHFVELDLLRGGQRMDYGLVSDDADYVMHVSRVEDRPQGRLWLYRVEDELPAIPIPLRSPDPDYALHLSAVLRTAYERGGYDLVVNHREPPDPPLRKKTADWCRKILNRAGKK